MTKPHPALTELYEIIKAEDWSSFCPEKLRQEKLDKWCRDWVVDVEFTQAVVSTEYLSSEYHDIIKYKLAQSLAEDLAEDCTQFTMADCSINAKMMAFRRKAKRQ
jgi:hypothetical protein